MYFRCIKTDMGHSPSTACGAAYGPLSFIIRPLNLSKLYYHWTCVILSFPYNAHVSPIDGELYLSIVVCLVFELQHFGQRKIKSGQCLIRKWTATYFLSTDVRLTKCMSDMKRKCCVFQRNISQ